MSDFRQEFVKRFNRRALLSPLLALCALVVGIQFIRPPLASPPATAELQAPPAVKEILQNSCYSCHSNQVRLAWFDRVVPAYWLVVSDVRKARKHLNFSEIGSLPSAQQMGMLFEAVNQVQLGAMPLRSFKQLHPGTEVTAEQLAVLKAYLNPAAPDIVASAVDITAADAQYSQWIAASTVSAVPVVQAAANGIEFIPDYKNWKPISSTDRFDNRTLREILGNDVAVKAIAEGHINPWPDGTAFAKIAWKQQEDEQRLVRTGAFIQVEFMLRDSKKFAATKNWGFARFRGMDLKPYGKDAAFAEECVSCHRPVAGSDYVYTKPAAQPSVKPLPGEVVTSWVDKQQATMSTLYGNDLAIGYARTHSGSTYPAGSALAVVTWNQQDDARWFGGRIGKQIQSVEVVRVSANADRQALYSYQKYEGEPLAKTVSEGDIQPNRRAAYLLSQRAAVLP